MSWEEKHDEIRRLRLDRWREMAEDYKQRRSAEMPPALPPSISYMDDLEILEEIGGPADLNGFPLVAEVCFSRACSAFPEREMLSILMKYSTDLNTARRHWPWVAHILKLFEAAPEFHDPSKDLTPTQAAELLKSIRAAASSLERDLNALQDVTLLWRDDERDVKSGHFEYLQQLIAQGAAGGAGAALDDDPTRAWDNFLQYRTWRVGLSGLIEGARHAQAANSPGMLTSKNRSRQPGLRKFVRRLGAVWESLTGRAPSIHKVQTRSRSASKFVMFVRDVASLSDTMPVPTPSQVASAFALPNKR